VGAVAEGFFVAVFTRAKIVDIFFFYRDFHGGVVSKLVGAVAEGLLYRAPTGTPPIFARVQLDYAGFFSGNNGVVHIDPHASIIMIQYAGGFAIIANMKQLKVSDLQILKLPPWSFELCAGDSVFLSGPSGSGKTRLLRALADLDPHQGDMWLDDISYSSMPAHEWRKKVAFLPAESQWWGVDVGAHFNQYDGELLQQLGFSQETMGWEVARLSSGEKQRLALLRALAESPEVLLLDEPTANLDDQCTRVIERVVEGLCRDHGLAAIWVTHNASQVQRIARHGWVLQGNEIIRQDA